MQYNLGGIDVLLRISIGLAIIGAGFYFHSWAGLLGLLPFVSGAMGVCPLYRALNISTYQPCEACRIPEPLAESQED